MTEHKSGCFYVAIQLNTQNAMVLSKEKSRKGSLRILMAQKSLLDV